MIDDELIAAHRARALTPDHPVVRGTAQNPDTFFQAREACNSLLRRVPRDRAGGDGPRSPTRTGRALPALRLRRPPEAERVIVMMGSGAETAHETVDWLPRAASAWAC